MESAETTSPPARAASSAASSVLPEAVGPKMAATAITAGGSGRGADRSQRAAQRLRGGRLDPHGHQGAGRGVAPEDDGLVLPRAAAAVLRVGARRALHQHLLLRPDQRLVPPPRVVLDALDQPL